LRRLGALVKSMPRKGVATGLLAAWPTGEGVGDGEAVGVGRGARAGEVSVIVAAVARAVQRRLEGRGRPKGAQA
jgi:hypothetical protein